MRLLEAVVSGVAVAVLAVGLALAVVTTPPVTRILVDHVGSADLAGLHPDQARALAEEVRAYVTRTDAPPLPSRVHGRPGFDAGQVSHLEDVRGVVSGARTATGAALVVVGGWLAWCVWSRRLTAVARAARVGAGILLVVPALVVLGGLFDFDAVFAGFHGLFFEAGTWTFSSTDLLIQLFPERFWVLAAAGWGALIALSGAVCLGVSALLGKQGSGPSE